MRIRRLPRLFLLLVLIAGALLWGLPWLLRVGPPWCERWELRDGICSAGARASLGRLDRWVERVLRPYSQEVRLERSVRSARGALQAIEVLARRGIGDERVEAALRGVDVALNEVERLLDAGQVSEKLQGVQENARRLLADARAALERLRTVLKRTERRAEDVSHAVENTQDTLDALSKVLPNKQ